MSDRRDPAGRTDSNELELEDVQFDEATSLALAARAAGPEPSPDVRRRLMASIRAADTPPGFAFVFDRDDDWMPHAVPGIRLKVLALNKARGYATLLLDVAPGTRFPPHHHGGAEECYVVSGSLFTCGRRLGPGDFVHADGDSDHGELYTEEGCRVILVVPPGEHLPAELIR
jgi:quercetin dioxygenase-like cupin family protein